MSSRCIGISGYGELWSATSVAHILNNISWNQNIEALIKASTCIGKLCKKLCALKKKRTRNGKAIVQLLSDDYAIPMSELPQQIPTETQDPMPPTAKRLRSM